MMYKLFLILIVVLGFCSDFYSQISNANFEEWVVIKGIEKPLYWETNNNYIASTPVDKEVNAIEGKYSMKLSSTALSTFGTYTEPGCAHIKIIPSEYYKSFNFCLRIDSIYFGQISVRIKQLESTGIYERIGGWNSSSKTSNVECISIPISQTNLDTIIIEIWALKTDDINKGIIGYSETVIDKLNFSKMPSGLDNAKLEPDWNVFSIFNTKMLFLENEKLDYSTINMEVVDLQGKIVYSKNLVGFGRTNIDLNFIKSGIYLICLSKKNVLIQRSSIFL